jgi:hypothetical protein
MRNFHNGKLKLCVSKYFSSICFHGLPSFSKLGGNQSSGYAPLMCLILLGQLLEHLLRVGDSNRCVGMTRNVHLKFKSADLIAADLI